MALSLLSDNTNLRSNKHVLPQFPLCTLLSRLYLTCWRVFFSLSSAVLCWWAAWPVVTCNLVLLMFSSMLFQCSVTAQRSRTQMLTSTFVQHSCLVLPCKSVHLQHFLYHLLPVQSWHLYIQNLCGVSLYLTVCTHLVIWSPKYQSARISSVL